MSSSQKMSVVIADAEPASRHGVVALLKAQPDFRIAGEADTVAAARALCRREKPALLLIDPALEGGAGRALIAELPRLAKTTHAVAFVRVVDAENVTRALQAGALGCVARHEAEAELLRVLLAAGAGGRCLSPRAMEAIAGGLANGALQVAQPRLTPREDEVFALLSEGRATGQIATALGISVKTVESHLEKLKHKFRVDSVRKLRGLAAGGGGKKVES